MLGLDSNFYGYSGGGANNAGTIFQMTPAGALTTLYSFGGSDGAPVGTLIQAADGNIYGATAGGGAAGQGIAALTRVFRTVPARANNPAIGTPIHGQAWLC
jgi:uncharacterized repeat protein (TIGR03803 family)